MDNFELESITKRRIGNEDLYKETLIEVFGEEITWEALKTETYENKLRVNLLLRDKISLKNSRLDPVKLAREIQNSRSGIGLAAMTTYTCAFCNSEEMWGSTAVPKICNKCALEMATNIALSHADIYKTIQPTMVDECDCVEEEVEPETELTQFDNNFKFNSVIMCIKGLNTSLTQGKEYKAYTHYEAPSSLDIIDDAGDFHTVANSPTQNWLMDKWFAEHFILLPNRLEGGE